MRSPWILAVALLLTACGDDPAPAPEIPSWAKVAPEQIAEANRIGIPISEETLHYQSDLLLGRGPGNGVTETEFDLRLRQDGGAELAITVDPWPVDVVATGAWRCAHDCLVLDMRKSDGGTFLAYLAPIVRRADEPLSTWHDWDVALHAAHDCSDVVFHCSILLDGPERFTFGNAYPLRHVLTPVQPDERGR